VSLDFASRAERFCEGFLAAEPSSRFVLGRGEYAQSIARSIPIGGFVDDFSTTPPDEGPPVIPSADLQSGSYVVVASMLRPHTAMRALDGHDVEVLDYFAFERFSGLPLKPVAFWDEFADDYAANADRYASVRSRLADDRSRDSFDRLVEARLTRDISGLSTFTYDMVNQYFEDFLDLEAQGESFVDIGCYDGMTSIEFARRAPGFRHITAFEPSAENRRKVVENLAPLGRDRVTIHAVGLSDHRGSVTFASDRGSASRVADDGGMSIDLERLDDIPLDSATFVKIDIEGEEIPALEGALATIRRFRPRLAVSVYHRAQDFWAIPEVVDRAGVDYELRLRHYTEGIDETVMFFLPRQLGPVR
jgi:FkbM family methyltransferase